MYKNFVNFLYLLLAFQITLHADWTRSLGELQDNQSLKKSYLNGLLTKQTYGIYKIDKLKSRDTVVALYKKIDNNLYWFGEGGELNYNIFNMIEAIKHSENEGLDPNRYHLSEIEFLYKKMTNGMLFEDRDHNLGAAKLDILLSDAFFTLISDLTNSQIDYTKAQKIFYNNSEKDDVNYSWEADMLDFDKIQMLEGLKITGDFVDSIYSLVTDNVIYNDLKAAYLRYKSILDQGGFVKIKPGKNLKIGSVSDRVVQLAQRLSQSGDLDFFDKNSKKFDKELKNALQKFQKRMGIWPSGILNSTTLKALNVPVKKRLSKIELNLNRARWERDSFNFRYILVNIPEFMMRFKDGDNPQLKAKVIVGKKQNPTPIFQAKMSYIVLNPRWSVPNSIVVKEFLELIQEDPYYFEDRNYKIYDGWRRDRKEVDSFDIDWFEYDEESKIPFNIVKEPGVKNPLGNVKFMFPNNHAVYLHDTPSKKLFKKAVRAFSHGCIRLHKPQKLLEFISNDYLGSTYSTIKSKLQTGENQSLTLTQKIPVYVRYYTVYVDKDDGVIFGNDIYGYDKIHQKLLEKNN